MGVRASPQGTGATVASVPLRRGVWVLLIALAALAPLVLHRAYFSGEALLYWSDSAQLQFPRYVSLCDALQRGEFPLWQTLVYAGSPFHANPENPTLYPPTLLAAALSTPTWTINLTILAHLSLAALGMFALVVRLGRRLPLAEGPLAAGALVAAVVFSFNQFMRRDHVNLVAYGAAHAWIPWMLLAADGLLHGDRPRRSAGLLALCVAAIFFTGGLYVIPYAYLGLVLWLLLLGLGGDRAERERTLRFGTLAAAAALLLIAAKLLPYLEWVPTTNRTGALPLGIARGSTLGELAAGGFAWSVVWQRCESFLGGGWVLLPGLLALGLARARVVRVLLGLTLLGFLIALGGATWRLLYEVVPPFDRIRSAVRAWTLVNAFYPPLAGLGTAWLLSRAGALRARPGVAAGLGLLLAAALFTQLVGNDLRDSLGRPPPAERQDPGQRFRSSLLYPDRLSELLERTPLWTEAAQRAGTSWRVGWPEFDAPASHTEQFVTSALGAETVVGQQGRVWPVRQETFVYGPPGARIDRATRLRRMGALSVRWVVESDPADLLPDPAVRGPGHIVPRGLQGSALVENPHARPRLVLPGVVVAVVDDEQGDVARRLLDHPRFPVAEAAVISLPWSRQPDGERASAEELAACDLVLVQSPLGASDEFDAIQQHLQRPGDLTVLGVHLGEDRLAELLAGIVDRIVVRAGERPTVELALERDGAQRSLLHVLSVDSARGRFAVASEPWSWYPGWSIEGLAQEPRLRIAEGISTAFLVPAGPLESPLVARYAPGSARRGFLFGALGLALALALVCAPRQRGA